MQTKHVKRCKMMSFIYRNAKNRVKKAKNLKIDDVRFFPYIGYTDPWPSLPMMKIIIANAFSPNIYS